MEGGQTQREGGGPDSEGRGVRLGEGGGQTQGEGGQTQRGGPAKPRPLQAPPPADRGKGSTHPQPASPGQSAGVEPPTAAPPAPREKMRHCWPDQPGSSATPHPPKTRRRRRTHVSLELLLRGRLDEPARAHDVPRRAHPAGRHRGGGGGWGSLQPAGLLPPPQGAGWLAGCALGPTNQPRRAPRCCCSRRWRSPRRKS